MFWRQIVAVVLLEYFTIKWHQSAIFCCEDFPFKIQSVNVVTAKRKSRQIAGMLWCIQGCNKGGTMPRASKSPNVASTSIPKVRTWKRQTCFLPRASSNLGSPLDAFELGCHGAVFRTDGIRFVKYWPMLRCKELGNVAQKLLFRKKSN